MQQNVLAGGADYVAYADETHHNIGRYRGVGLITLKAVDDSKMRYDLEQILTGTAIVELKWGELRSAKKRFVAIRVFNYIIEQAIAGNLRLDVLTWDIEDSRHKIQGRNDVRNLQRMYYFLFKNVLCKRWPTSGVWKLCVDESSSQPWSHLNYLREIKDWNTGESVVNLNIEEICEVKSHQEPLIQVADLFAGLGVFSRSSYERYLLWGDETKREDSTQVSSKPTISKSDRERFEVLAHFDKQCKTFKLGVSLKQSGGLRTFGPSKPINFWWYEPQGTFDKAPV